MPDTLPDSLAGGFFELSREAMLVLAPDSALVLAANPAAAALYGRLNGTLQTLCFPDLTVEPAFTWSVLREQRTNVPLRYHLRGDGSHFPVTLTLRYLDEASGGAVLVVVSDVSERMTFERHVRDTERKYSGVFASAPYPILLLDSRRVVLDANEAAAQLYGGPVTLLIGRRIGELLVDPLRAVDFDLMQPGELSPQWHRRVDGRSFLAEVTLSAIRQSRTTALLAVIRDVTEVQHQLEQLRLSEQRWQFALEALGHGLWEWLPETGEMLVSACFLSQLGYAEGEPHPVGMADWEARIHPDDMDRYQRAILTCITDATTSLSLEMRVLNQAGDYRWLEVRGRVMETNPFGHAQRVVGTARDIHDERQREERERSRLEQILHMQRLAGLGEMATTLAHELNQPLAAMGNFAAVLSRRLDPGAAPEVMRAVDNIATLVTRAGGIVQRVRGFARKEAMNPILFEFPPLLEEILHFVEFQARGLGVDIQVDMSGDLPLIWADRLQMGQVLLNLIKNGLEALADVEVERALEIKVRVIVGSALEIVVADTGCGLPEQVALDVFEPFFTTKVHGLGLGLAICKTIIEHHDGRISAMVNQPKGTRFHIVLPLRK